jgi:putative flippase GtrA
MRSWSLQAWLGRIFQNRFIRFVVVGAINSIVGFSAFTVILLLGAPAWIAIAGGNVLGIVFNFFSTGGVVFRDLSLSNMPRFVACSLLLLALNVCLMDWLSPLIGGRIVTQALLTAPLAVVSYLGMTKLVFRGSGVAAVGDADRILIKGK